MTLEKESKAKKNLSAVSETQKFINFLLAPLQLTTVITKNMDILVATQIAAADYAIIAYWIAYTS